MTYIVQIKNPQRFSWRELEYTNCRFQSLSGALDLYSDIKQSRMYAGIDVRIWQLEADHRVEITD